jgi:dihydrolipoamide dehydrogenase
MAERDVQLAVIGAGPGGYAAAFLAADLGMTVALVDGEPNPGGVCLYRGCIPSKALLHVSKLMDEVEAVRQAGVDYAEPKVDLDKLREWKGSVVERLTGGLGQLTKRRKIRYVQGTAAFRDSNTIDVDLVGGESESLSFEHAIVATGSRPAAIPSLDLDSPRVLDSSSALDIESVPDSLLVVGGGYIGLELGSVYAALGSKVKVVEMLSGILPGADRDLVKVLGKRLEAKFDSIAVNTTVASMDETKDGVAVTFEGDGAGEEKFDAVLVSVGRRPNSEELGLDNTKVAVDDKGFIEVDDRRRTADPSIFAIGDVVGEPMLAHKASHEGRTAVEAIAGHKVAFEPNAIPAVIFTDPEIAWAGLTETAAKEKGIDVEVAKFPWAASGRALTLERPDGLTKLIVEPKTERILGVGIVGAGAGDLIAEGVLAIEMGANATDLKLTIHPHPTLSETVMEAAEVFFGQSTHVYRPKRK